MAALSTTQLEAIVDERSPDWNGYFGKCEPKPADAAMIEREIRRRDRIHRLG
jgi:hypothetical protein